MNSYIVSALMFFSTMSLSAAENVLFGGVVGMQLLEEQVSAERAAAGRLGVSFAAGDETAGERINTLNNNIEEHGLQLHQRVEEQKNADNASR